jgi:molybdopterin biosynthesis enzyme
MVSFELFARPGLRRMTGHEGPGRTVVDALADDGLPRRPDGKTHLVRVLAAIGDDGRVHVRSSGGQGSHQLSAMAAATALAVVPDGEGIDPGGSVETILVDRL